MSTPPKNRNDFFEIDWSGDLDQLAITANLTRLVAKCPVGRTMRVDRAYYTNDTGLAANGVNNFNLVLKNGATTVATVFATAAVALVAGTTVDAVITAANAVLASGAALTAAFTLAGAQTLPPGRLRVEGRYV